MQKFLGSFVEDTWKRWLEAEAEMLAGELESLAERVIQVASENADEVTRQVAEELGGERAKLSINVDTFKYDASVFALGALGTTVFLFVNTLAGGLLALAAPVAAMVLRGRVAAEIKAEAKQQAPEAVRRIGATLGPAPGRADRRVSPPGCRSSWPRRGRRWPGASPRCCQGRWPSARRARARRQARATRKTTSWRPGCGRSRSASSTSGRRSGSDEEAARAARRGGKTQHRRRRRPA